MQTLYYIKMKGWNETILMHEDVSLYTNLPLAEKVLAALKKANKDVKPPMTGITYDTGQVCIFSNEAEVPLLQELAKKEEDAVDKDKEKKYNNTTNKYE